MTSKRSAALRSLVCLAALVASGAAFAGEPAQSCRRVGTDDRLRSPPDEMMPAIRRIFGLDDNYPSEAAYYRCLAGRVLVCFVGANIPCGKANRARSSQGANEWCDNNPDSDLVPMAATGHDTLYAWKCVGRVARPAKPVGGLDSRGFFKENWKLLR